jgi:hypothetical protein
LQDVCTPSPYVSLHEDGEMGTRRRIMKDVWEPVPGTRFFTRNGAGLYERLTEHLYLRVDDVDENDARELGGRFADAFETRAPVRMVA